MVTDISRCGSRINREIGIYDVQHNPAAAGAVNSFIGMRAASTITTQNREAVNQRTFSDVGRIAIEVGATYEPHRVRESSDLCDTTPVSVGPNTLDHKELAAGLVSWGVPKDGAGSWAPFIASAAITSVAPNFELLFFAGTVCALDIMYARGLPGHMAVPTMGANPDAPRRRLYLHDFFHKIGNNNPPGAQPTQFVSDGCLMVPIDSLDMLPFYVVLEQLQTDQDDQVLESFLQAPVADLYRRRTQLLTLPKLKFWCAFSSFVTCFNCYKLIEWWCVPILVPSSMR